MCKKITLVGLVSLCVLTALLQVVTTSSGSDQHNEANVDLSLREVTSEKITIEFDPPERTSGTLEVELYELDGKLIAKVTRRHKGRPLHIDLVAQIDKKDLANYYLRYRFNSNQDFRRRSLLFVGEILETMVLGQREFVAGTHPVIRVLVRDRAAGIPIRGAEVAVELTHEDKVISKFTAKTDANGEVAARLEMPDMVLRNARLKVSVTSRTGKDTVEETVQVRSSLRTLLTMDKPLYQPG
jgi:hypothetical protein